jgi:hypothetical protein
MFWHRPALEYIFLAASMAGACALVVGIGALAQFLVNRRRSIRGQLQVPIAGWRWLWSALMAVAWASFFVTMIWGHRSGKTGLYYAREFNLPEEQRLAWNSREVADQAWDRTVLMVHFSGVGALAVVACLARWPRYRANDRSEHANVEH